MRCPSCNTENAPETSRCGSCGAALGPARPKGARRRGPAEETDTPCSADAEGTNRAALRAYRVAVLGLVPGLGLLLGPLAVVLGTAARRRGRSDPDFTARSHAAASVVLGALTAATNWLGVALMVRGLRN
jgi:hypothetical protein